MSASIKVIAPLVGSVIVNITNAGLGGALTAYGDPGLTVPTALPATLAAGAAFTFYVPTPRAVALSVLLGTTQVASPAQGTPLTMSLENADAITYDYTTSVASTPPSFTTLQNSLTALQAQVGALW